MKRILPSVSARVTVSHFQPVLAVAISPDGKTLASGSSDKTARVWNVAPRQ